MTRDEYYDRLAKCQNIIALKGIPVDIMTITGFMNWEEKLKHLEYYEKQTKEQKVG
jgi:hypothetical protein